MSSALQTMPDASAIEQTLVQGDLAKLGPAQRVSYYNAVCRSLGLNPLTKPFDYLSLNGKLVLYAKRDACDQLRKINGVSITALHRELLDGVYVVTAHASDATGRTDSALGAVALDGLKGEARANALMKAETKAKRRVTLSICGLGMNDESEVGGISGVRVQAVDLSTGEIVEPARPQIAAPRQPDPDPEPAPTALGDAVTVAGVEARKWRKKDGSEGVFWTVSFSDGFKAATFSETLAEQAGRFHAEQVPCEYQSEAGKKEGTYKLTELSRAVGADE